METDSVALAFIGERLAADFAGTGLPEIEFRTPGPQWGNDSGVLVVCGGHEFLIPDGSVEQGCWAAVWQLSDDVMGELNRPWPELLDADGTFVGVLDVPTTPPNVAVWMLKGKPFCAVGHLHRAVAAAGLRIKGDD